MHLTSVGVIVVIPISETITLVKTMSVHFYTLKVIVFSFWQPYWFPSQAAERHRVLV